MIVPILLILLGLVLLVAGGEIVVRGATGLARAAGVSPAVVGLTVVAAGTSMPELFVSLDAALAGTTDLAIANVVGSNIFNVGAILGIAALIAPLVLHGNSVRYEWPVMFLASGQFYLLSRDGVLDRIEGGFFVVALILFTIWVVRLARTEVTPQEAEELAEATSEPPATATRGRAIGLGALALAAGCGLLVVGAHSLVVGAIDIAAAAGVSTTVIGLTVVAAGTSLPELAASAVASFRGHHDIAVANVLGSNIFNVLCIMGCTALVKPLPVANEVLERDMMWMIGLSLLLWPLMRSGLRISRLEGVLLLTTFAVYLAMLLT